jgi:hypothetical protein
MDIILAKVMNILGRRKEKLSEQIILHQVEIRDLCESPITIRFSGDYDGSGM